MAPQERHGRQLVRIGYTKDESGFWGQVGFVVFHGPMHKLAAKTCMIRRSGMEYMKLLLVMPDARIHRLRLGPVSRSFREAPLTLTMLAALIPEALDVHIKLVDESIDAVPLKDRFDLVGISCLTGTAGRAYELADYFRRKGAAVVLGGIHVTLRPEEAAKHADCIVTGFAERTWPRLLTDFAGGKLQARYHDFGPSLEGLPLPRRDLQRRSGYIMPDTVFATRGCKRNCDFCSVPAAAFGWRTRPVTDVIDEIRRIPHRRIAFNDVSLLEDREYARELLTALIPLGKLWGGLCTTRVLEDPEMMNLLYASGCRYMLIGFESVSTAALSSVHKGFNRPEQFAELIRQFHRRAILVQGCFVFGFDHDTRAVFHDTVDAVQQMKIDIPRYAIYTPYPGTEAYQRLKEENRLLHEYWPHYDTQHVVFQPAHMTPEELDCGFRDAYRKTFRLNSIVRRILGSGVYFPVTLVGNLAYRLYIDRLRNESCRILRTTAPSGSLHPRSRTFAGADPSSDPVIMA